eukprot:m.21878 g.21878  ORF g.21878 m.21878 type:complete len:94 (-) comp3960_c0_seq1:329-610(-)
MCSSKKREICTELSATNSVLHRRVALLQDQNTSLAADNARLDHENSELSKALAADTAEVDSLRTQLAQLLAIMEQTAMPQDMAIDENDVSLMA